METIFFYFVSNVVQQEQYEALAARRPIFSAVTHHHGNQ